MVVKLMCLCASGDISQADPNNRHTLSYLATVIATLAHSNTSASKLLLNVCSRELFLASFGLQAGLVLRLTSPTPIQSHLTGENNSSPNFSVIQSLVGLMVQTDNASVSPSLTCKCTVCAFETLAVY